MRFQAFGVFLSAGLVLSLSQGTSFAQDKTNPLRGALLAEFKAHNSLAWQAVFSRDGKIRGRGGDSPRLRWWDGSTGKPLPPVDRQPRFPVRCVAMSPNGKLLAS